MAAAAAAAAAAPPSYINHALFLSPDFSAHAHAHALIAATNDPSDPTVDLTTPLSRVLFDLQEIDTHIHTLTSGSALPLLSYTAHAHATSTTLLSVVTAQTQALNSAYAALQQTVLARAETAQQVVTACTNLHAATTTLRDLSRALALARTVELQLSTPAAADSGVRAAYTLVELRAVLPGVAALRLGREIDRYVAAPAEELLADRARAALEAGVGVGGEREGVLAAALRTLAVLGGEWLAGALADWVGAHVDASVGVLARALTALTTLDRALAEVGARCEGVLDVERVLGRCGLADRVVEVLDGGVVAAFWSGVAKGWEGRVREVVGRGGANARILRAGRERVREGVRACVWRAMGGEGGAEGAVAVMLGAVGALGR